MPVIEQRLFPIVLLAAFSALAVALTAFVAQRRALRRVMGVLADGDMRSGLARLAAGIDPLAERLRAVEEIQRRLVEGELGRVGAPGLVHFQAYGNDGPPLSFSLAILDARRDGMVLTSLYGRDQVRLYAKSVRSGGAAAELASEESLALELAMSGGGHEILQGDGAIMVGRSPSAGPRPARGRVRR